MRIITTRLAETSEEKSIVIDFRHDYYNVSREIDIASEAGDHNAIVRQDRETLHFATFAGDDLVGCFRVEIGAPDALRFGADWDFSDFVDELPERTARVDGLCTVRHLRDERVITHMVRESVAIAKELDLPHVFFEVSPQLWPLFHTAGLTRRGSVLPDRITGFQTAVFRLDRRTRVRFPQQDRQWAIEEGGDVAAEAASRPRLQVLVGGRG